MKDQKQASSRSTQRGCDFSWAGSMRPRVPRSGNWRLTFIFEGSDAVLVDYQDYH